MNLMGIGEVQILFISFLFVFKFRVQGGTISPRTHCTQTNINAVVSKDFCSTGEQVIFKGTSSTWCVVPSSSSGSAERTSTSGLQTCSTGDALHTSEPLVKTCQPNLWNLRKKYNVTVCKAEDDYYWWSKQNRSLNCRLPNSVKTEVPGRVASCPTAQPATGSSLPTCSPAVLQTSTLAQTVCQHPQQQGLFYQFSAPGLPSCHLRPVQLPVFAKVLPKDSCTDSATSNLNTAQDPSLRTALADCVHKNIVDRAKHLKLQICMYKALLLVWDEKNRKVCIRHVKFVRNVYPECPIDVDDVVKNIVALSSQNVDTEVVRFCTLTELTVGNSRIYEKLYNCFYRQDYFVWFGRSQEVCKKPKGHEPTFSKWKYCPKEVIDTMVLQGSSRGVNKRKAETTLTMMKTSDESAKKSKNYYKEIEEEIRQWVEDSFPVTGERIENMELREEPGTSRGKRAVEDSRSVLIVRKMRQTPDSILAKFTVVVDSRQVQGMDFAAELERSMKENAHAFGGLEGNLQIDPSSIQVQEEMKAASSPSSSHFGKTSARYTMIAGIVASFLLAVTILVIIMLKKIKLPVRN